jgi:hypothetical protein
MKTTIVTLITLATIAFNNPAANASTIKNTNNSSVPVTVAVNNISKIEASGNVEVYITNGAKDDVKVYDRYYSKNALVQGKDGVLRISSYSKEKLVVLVTVTDLRAITAYDNAVIKSDKRLSVIDLTVVLNNHASAQLKLDAFAANFTVNDRATADLSGNITDYNVNYSQSSTINKTELVADNVTEQNTTKEAARRMAIANVASL